MRCSSDTNPALPFPANYTNVRPHVLTQLFRDLTWGATSGESRGRLWTRVSRSLLRQHSLPLPVAPAATAPQQSRCKRKAPPAPKASSNAGWESRHPRAWQERHRKGISGPDTPEDWPHL